MKRLHSLSAVALTGLVGFSSLCAPLAAAASEQGKKNTALGLGALAAGLLLTQKNKLTGVLAAGGAAYAYSQYDKDVKNRHQREQYGYYDGGSNNDYRTGRDNYNDRYHQDSSYRTGRDNNDSVDQDNRDRTNHDNDGQVNRNNRDRANSDNRQDNGYRYHENSGDSRQAARSRDRVSNETNRSGSRRTGSNAFGR